MSKDNYPLYGLMAVAGAGITVWAGLPVSVLLFVLVCPLMMFFMMRGMHGGQEHGNSHSMHSESGSSGTDTNQAAVVNGARRADGSHERIDHR